ncbi:MAG: hypothetical protein ABI178_06315 [Rhodanobacter sp.]
MPLHTLVEVLEHDVGLRQPQYLHQRLDALDRLELLASIGSAAVPPELRQRVARLQADFDALNAALYAQLREDIRRGIVPPLLTRCMAEAAHEEVTGDSYDWRDELLDGVLQLSPPASTTAALPPEMVAYQPTPARHILALLARTQLTADDVLVDFGSGLGHVPLLTSICTGAKAIGIECEPAHVAIARAGARALQLSNVQFHCQDARAADLASATLFYLYTPFVGTVLHDMLEILRRHSAGRSIRIAAHGPCVAALAAQDWLLAEGTPAADRITLFRPRR